MDFFTNLPSNIEATQDDGLLTANLQADFNSEINSIPFNIFQGGSFNNSFLKTHDSDLSIVPFRPRQTGVLEVNPITRRHSKSLSQVSETQIGMGEIDTTQIGIPKVSVRQNSVSNTAIASWGITQSSTAILPWVGINSFFEKERLTSAVIPTEIGTSEVNVTKIGSIQVDPSQNSFTEIDSMKIDSSKVTFPSSIAIQQLLSGQLQTHNLTPNLDNIYSTAQSIWQTTTPIDFNFAITNLPTGQLAEATITGYDQLGRPNTATITIDDDANSVGWFIDTTPQDNSEFQGVGVLGSGGVGEYFQATADSEAYGKYDLLTTILHEMGHTLGIINGYSEFNKYVKGKKFITDTFTAHLTPDGSHLDTTYHPYDLMNTSLKPGIRKLPSTMDWAILDTLW